MLHQIVFFPSQKDATLQKDLLVFRHHIQIIIIIDDLPGPSVLAFGHFCFRGQTLEIKWLIYSTTLQNRHTLLFPS